MKEAESPTTELVYTPEIKSSTHHYPFGMQMAGRGIKGDYRYGYQGSELDNEVAGDGNSYTTEFRQLDPRLGRWFSVDPVSQPWQSPYTSMDNNPVNLIDPSGLTPDKNGGDGDVDGDGRTFDLEEIDEEDYNPDDPSHIKIDHVHGGSNYYKVTERENDKSEEPKEGQTVEIQDSYTGNVKYMPNTF